jgi:hypothetical protein
VLIDGKALTGHAANGYGRRIGFVPEDRRKDWSWK